MSLALAFLGTSTLLLIGSILLNYQSMMLLGELFAGISGIIILLECFIHITVKFHFINILSATTLISTGYGTFNTCMSVGFGSGFNLYILQKLGLSSIIPISLAQLFVNFYSMCLLLIVQLSNSYTLLPKHKQKYLHEKANNKLLTKLINLLQDTRKIAFLLLLCASISFYQIYLLLTGKYGFLFQGITSKEGYINVEVALAVTLIPFLSLSLGILLFQFNQLKNVFSQTTFLLLYCLIVTTQLQWLFITASRREMGYNIIVFLLGIRLYFIGKPLSNKKKNKLIVLVSLLTLFLLFSGVYFTSFLRVLANNTENIDNYSFIKLFNYTLQSYLYFSQNSYLFQDEFTNSIKYNLATRTFVLSPLAMLLEKIGNKEVLFGNDIFLNLLKSLPGIFYKDKYFLVTSEALYSQKFGLPAKDFADSFYLSAFVDFSWLGALLYPLFLYFIFWLFVQFTLSSKSVIVIAFATAKMMNLCLLGGESSLTTLFTGFRDILILLFLGNLIKYFFRQTLATK